MKVNRPCGDAVTDAPEELTDAKGAYLLLMNMSDPVTLPPHFAHQTLAPGRYGYAGSAYGPGGIRARCRRHLERPSTLRWHIDWLTRSADQIQVVAIPGGTECHLIERLAEAAEARFPIPGFGSTDCRLCRAHLVKLSEKDTLDDTINILLSKASPKG